MKLKLAVVTLVALVWSCLAFCGEIHDAALAGDLEKVKVLLKAHPDLINSKDTNGMTPLHFAAHNGNKDMVEFLLADKVKVNAKARGGITPLYYAAEGGHLDVVELLLANKADVNAKASDGRTALHWAAEDGH